MDTASRIGGFAAHASGALEHKNSMQTNTLKRTPLHPLYSNYCRIRPDDYRFSLDVDDDGWLNLLAPHPVTFEGIQFPTTEHLFQWLRFVGFPVIQDAIRAAASPNQAKEITLEHCRAIPGRIFSVADIDDLRRCLRAKLTQYPQCVNRLRATGQVRLVADLGDWEPCFHPFWGAVEIEGEWHGENIAGCLWMELRDELNTPAASPLIQPTLGTQK